MQPQGKLGLTDLGGDGVVNPDSLRSIVSKSMTQFPSAGLIRREGSSALRSNGSVEVHGEIQEQWDVGVSALQVGEGCVDHRGQSISSGSVPCVGVVIGVHSDTGGVLNVGHNHPLKALHDQHC